MLLYIVRHGKAQRDSPSGRDSDRPLQPRGERQALWLGRLVAERRTDRRPGVILSSPFVRARDTARLLHQSLPMCELHFDESLELGGPPEDVVELINRHAAHDPVMVVGHNPQLESLLELLAHGLAGDAAELRTGECAVLEFKGARVAPGEGTLVETLRLED